MTSDQTDGAQLVPMLDQVEKRSDGLRPKEHLVDGGYAALQGIDEAEKRGVRVYAPVPEARSEGNDPYERQRDDTDRTAAWRARMKTKSAHAIYTQRAATAETINADQRAWRGMHRFGVRGTAKV